MTQGGQSRVAIVFERTGLQLQTLSEVVAGLGVAVLAECSSVEEVFPLMEGVRPNLFVVGLPSSGWETEGTALLEEARARFPSLDVIVISASEDDAKIHSLLTAGADAYVVASEDRDEMAAALRAAFDRFTRKVPIPE